MVILIHTSKTMRPPAENSAVTQIPVLLDKAKVLSAYLKTVSVEQIVKTMHVSPKLAEVTYTLTTSWTDETDQQRAALDSFIGDIYSGLQVLGWTDEDRDYANKTLRILSGLYGILSPLDGIYPYRLEMGYKLPDRRFSNLYTFWGDTIAATLPKDSPIINLAAMEYSKVITDYVDTSCVITPTFLTIHPKTHEPTFVVVHAKIARGAFARWLIKERITDTKLLPSFNDLGYAYNKELSTGSVPVFICESFGGIGLSVRLKN
jgi:cytoplasmic iron level regulating protein YaaA (DUF328/UPF0246 family)